MDSEPLGVPPSWPNAEALFRSQIIAPLVDPLSTKEDKKHWRQRVTSREHTLPNGKTCRISERTLRRWVESYRKAGWLSLERCPRQDRGRLRKLTKPMVERAKELKLEEPRRSIPHVLRILETEFEEAIDVTPGALWRHLDKAGLGGRSTTPLEGFRRWETTGPNQLWQSDVKHGIYLPDPLKPEKMRKTYLIAFIDDYSRCIMHSEWYWAEDVYSLELCFQKALLRKGKPARVYVDRGLIYQSQVFRTACASLGIRHISATARRPEGKGKIERYWRNVDSEVLLELEHCPVQSLEELNRRYWAWVEEVYHTRVHSRTGTTPLARYANQPPLENPERLAELFLWRAKRRVDRTGCVSFQGNTYQLESGLEGRKVELRYHPLHLARLQVWTGERRWADALPLELHHSHAGVNPRHILPEKKTPALYLETLVRRHETRKRQLVSPLKMCPEKGE